MALHCIILDVIDNVFFCSGCRFESTTKNFKLYYDGQHYVGEKRFDTVQDLVADGLITFYLEAKAADYIAALSSQSNYAESPYVAYNTQKRRQQAHPKSSKARHSTPVPSTRSSAHTAAMVSNSGSMGSRNNKAILPLEGWTSQIDRRRVTDNVQQQPAQQQQQQSEGRMPRQSAPKRDRDRGEKDSGHRESQLMGGMQYQRERDSHAAPPSHLPPAPPPPVIHPQSPPPQPPPITHPSPILMPNSQHPGIPGQTILTDDNLNGRVSHSTNTDGPVRKNNPMGLKGGQTFQVFFHQSRLPSKYKMFNQCWFNVGPAS